MTKRTKPFQIDIQIYDPEIGDSYEDIEDSFKFEDIEDAERCFSYLQSIARRESEKSENIVRYEINEN